MGWAGLNSLFRKKKLVDLGFENFFLILYVIIILLFFSKFSKVSVLFLGLCFVKKRLIIEVIKSVEWKRGIFFAASSTNYINVRPIMAWLAWLFIVMGTSRYLFMYLN